jgi:hypothetical protein
MIQFILSNPFEVLQAVVYGGSFLFALAQLRGVDTTPDRQDRWNGYTR